MTAGDVTVEDAPMTVWIVTKRSGRITTIASVHATAEAAQRSMPGDHVWVIEHEDVWTDSLYCECATCVRDDVTIDEMVVQS